MNGIWGPHTTNELKKFLLSTQYSNIPIFQLIPTPSLMRREWGLELGCLTQISLDNLWMILNNFRCAFSDLFSKI
jgi:hypothetical protein